VARQIGRSITPEMARDMGLDRQILNQLIRDAAFTAQAIELGLAVPDQAVANRIASNPAFQGSRKASSIRRTSAALMAQNGISEGEFVASSARPC
jgi:peptidyl-prolyl cis-trans isomerase D